MVNNNIAGNIISYNGVSDRIAWIKVRLSKRYTLKVIQVYAPTANSTDQEIEEFYDDLSNIIDHEKTNYTMIIGDLNAKVGERQNGEYSMGKYGIGQRNARGDMLVNFAERHGLKIANTFFQKRQGRKWTWKSPNGTTKNEIDFIITDKIDNIKDVTVTNKIDIGSDHRMVACRTKFNFKSERNKMILKKKCPRNIEMENKEAFQTAVNNRFETLWTENCDVDEKSTNLTNIIKEAAESLDRVEIITRKYSKGTVNLIKKKQNIKLETDEDLKEMTELTRIISKRMRREKRRQNVETIMETL